MPTLPPALRILPRQDLASSPISSRLSEQWHNPADILSLLLIIGPDIVQKALAQMSHSSTTFHSGLTPICFSFGWVGYSFNALASMAGQGRLMPQTDFPCKVINLESGMVRENKSWLLGRLARDAEGAVNDDEALHIRVFTSVDDQRGQGKAGDGRRDGIWWVSLGVVALQLGLAAMPGGMHGDWGALIITGLGTLLAGATGLLPQWSAEKLACRRNSKKVMALTVGNGSRHVCIVKGNGNTLDLEDLAMGAGPKTRRSWLNSGVFVKPGHRHGVAGSSAAADGQRRPIMVHGLPLDFWLTRLACIVLACCWIALLISTAGLRENTWFLILVGGIGMLQNGILATVSRDPGARGLHVREITEFRGAKVMDILMDLECMFSGYAKPLVEEYFPTGLRPDERLWWNGEREAYDEKRYREKQRRGIPASMQTAQAGGDEHP